MTADKTHHSTVQDNSEQALHMMTSLPLQFCMLVLQPPFGQGTSTDNHCHGVVLGHKAKLDQLTMADCCKQGFLVSYNWGDWALYKVKELLVEEQAGFTSHKSTLQQIFNCRIFTEKQLQQDLYQLH